MELIEFARKYTLLFSPPVCFISEMEGRSTESWVSKLIFGLLGSFSGHPNIC